MEGNFQERKFFTSFNQFLERMIDEEHPDESLMTHNSVTPGLWQKADISSITRASSPKSGRGRESFLKELSNPILWTLSQKIKFAILFQQQQCLWKSSFRNFTLFMTSKAYFYLLQCREKCINSYFCSSSNLTSTGTPMKNHIVLAG